MTRRLGWLLALVGMSVEIGVAQEAARPQNAPPTFGVTSASVLVDVVVRDKKGNLVQDLTPADFEIFEDGVRQRADAFAVVGSPVPAAAAAAPAAAEAAALPPPAAPPQEHAVVALIFDRLNPEARKLASDAALSFVQNGRKEGDLVGVFLLDLKLRLIQDFTVDAEAIKAAVSRVALKASLPSTADADERRLNSINQLTDLNVQAEGLAGVASGDPTMAMASGALGAQIAMAKIAVRMEETFSALERDQRGLASVNGLKAIVDALRILPGRKTVVFFSEGMEITTVAEDRFREVIHLANRANVAVYTMDAAGLRTTSGQQMVRREMEAVATLRRSQGGQIGDPGRPMTQAMERNEDALRLNPQNSLGTLAEETGAFMIHDTNDLRAGFRRINEEMRFYYMLSYSPTNENLDGAFREINVRLKRPGLIAQARKGYYAVRSQGPVMSYEAPVLALLERGAKPAAFPVRAAALSFPDPRQPGLVSVVVEVPGTAPAYGPAQDKGSQSADFVVLVRISDQAGNPLDKLSQRYRPSVPEARLDAMKQNPVIFYRETHLPKGRYVLDAVAYDNSTSKAARSSLSFEVPVLEGGRLLVGSLVTIGRVEQLPKDEVDPSRPLQYGEIQLYPNLDGTVKKSARRPLVFLMTAWTTPGSPLTRATAEVVRGGQVVKQAVFQVPPPEPSGRVQALGQLPLDTLQPGDYDLRVVVGDGKTTETRSAPFTLEE